MCRFNAVKWQRLFMHNLAEILAVFWILAWQVPLPAVRFVLNCEFYLATGICKICYWGRSVLSPLLFVMVVEMVSRELRACPRGMHSPGMDGEGELRGHRLTRVHLEKWSLKRSVCVCYWGRSLVGHSSYLTQVHTTPISPRKQCQNVGMKRVITSSLFSRILPLTERVSTRRCS